VIEGDDTNTDDIHKPEVMWIMVACSPNREALRKAGSIAAAMGGERVCGGRCPITTRRQITKKR
jgi:hypothetical protein